jgi:hypothetical protein
MHARCLETGEVYSHLKEEALDRIKWRNRFGRGFGLVVWQITDDDDVASLTEGPQLWPEAELARPSRW